MFNNHLFIKGIKISNFAGDQQLFFNMKSIKFYLAILILIFSAIQTSSGQERPQHELHSMMIYNFLKYIQWPDGKNSGDFRIGIVGSDDVYNTLNTWYGNKTRGNKNFIIQKMQPEDDLSQCQLIYVGKTASSMFDKVLSKVADKPVLTVTNKNGLGEAGSCINFKVVQNRLKFELNQEAVSKTNLKTSSQLTNMAILI